MQAISENGDLYVTKRGAHLRIFKGIHYNFLEFPVYCCRIATMQIRHLLDSHNPISTINYGREKNIPTQILIDKYGFGVSFGE